MICSAVLFTVALALTGWLALRAATAAGSRPEDSAPPVPARHPGVSPCALSRGAEPEEHQRRPASRPVVSTRPDPTRIVACSLDAEISNETVELRGLAKRSAQRSVA